MVSIQVAVYERNENLTMQMISSNSRYNNESTTTRCDNNNNFIFIGILHQYIQIVVNIVTAIIIILCQLQLL